MQCIVGDRTGLVKVVALKNKAIVARHGVQQKGLGVVHMAWAGAVGVDAESEIAVAQLDGLVKCMRVDTGEVSHCLRLAPANTLPANATAPPCVGLGVRRSADGGRAFFTVAADGDVRLTPFKACEEGGDEWIAAAAAADDDDEVGDGDASKSASKMTNKRKKKNTKSGKECVRWQVGGDVCAAALDNRGDRNRFAVGGKEHLLSVWDIETQQRTFKARNVPHDFLELRVPVWIQALCWVGSKIHARSLQSIITLVFADVLHCISSFCVR
jgi:ribosome biogenesis protein NSA1